MNPSNHKRGGDGDRVRVAITGAGLSGLACAGAIADRGFDVRVFDKARAPGGAANRLNTFSALYGVGWRRKCEPEKP